MGKNKKICWGITGAGDYILETIEIMEKIRKEYDFKITIIISTEGVTVLKWYKLLNKLQETFEDVRIEKGPNIPFIIGPLQTGSYKFLFVSPLTGNSTAKVALGIADTLITNAISQTMKGNIPVYVYPVDQKEGELTTILPNGKKLTLKSRKIDLQHVENLRKMDGIEVLSHPNEILEIIKKYL
ncbi:MAG: archaeoflavoprotein AfpA [Candidatus Lokiarchaeota archaeon]|nr:archaeoflavoprotein AfpA [Candidatus Lokiarchaeota archaeon]